MDKGVPPTLFTNDGSFMERFKQLQQEQDKQEKSITLGGSKPKTIVSRSMTPNSTSNKTSGEHKTGQSASGGKLAFSLKQKSKLVVSAVKLGEDEDEGETDTGNGLVDAPTKRQKVDQPIVSGQSFRQVDVASALPSDPAVRKVADKLASFVAKNGRQFEDITRQKNPGDTLFKFLFDVSRADYKYYEYRLAEEEKALSGMRDSQSSYNGGTSTSASKPASGSPRLLQQQPNYQIPASALYDTAEDTRGFRGSIQGSSYVGKAGGSSAPTSTDPIAMMEYYMKKAAHEERRRQPKQSKDEMPPPDSLQDPAGPGKKGHHMGDYIPQEELEKFLASCNDVAAQKAAQEAAQRAKIQADNVGHKLLSKMGWKEGEGLGSSRSGIADPVMAGNVKKDNLGVGASAPGEVTPEDDIYEQYKKRMMLGYKHRPNPLGNPRKAYY